MECAASVELPIGRSKTFLLVASSNVKVIGILGLD